MASNKNWKVLLFILLVAAGLGSGLLPEVRKVRMTNEALAVPILVVRKVPLIGSQNG
jgi:hypothetical protein